MGLKLQRAIRIVSLLLSSLTHEDFVFCELQLLHCYHVFTINCCLQGSLVDQIFQVSAREAHCAPGDDTGLNSCRNNTQNIHRVFMVM